MPSFEGLSSIVCFRVWPKEKRPRFEAFYAAVGQSGASRKLRRARLDGRYFTCQCCGRGQQRRWRLAVTLPKTLALIAVFVAATMIGAWLLWPVQILVLASRLAHPVAENRPIRWAEGPARPPAGSRPPNIVLIVADDLGINDLTAEGTGTGVAGGLVPTPHIDAIAHQGADFTVAYAANATCSPSRAALMTGRYPTRFGFEFTAVPDQLAKYVPRYSPKNRPYPTIYHASRSSFSIWIAVSTSLSVTQKPVSWGDRAMTLAPRIPCST